MAKRIKAEQFEVDDPEVAMARFKAGLARLVRVPKSAIKAKRKRAKKRKA
jgi:hypothetical protein